MTRRAILLALIVILIIIILGVLLLRGCNVPGTGAPVAVDDSFTTTIDTPLVENVLTNDSHPDGDTLTVDGTTVSGPSNGTVILQPTGAFTYTPSAGFTGGDEFVYSVCDSDSDCAQGTVSITVTSGGGGAGPDAVDDSFNTVVDTAVSDNVLNNDTHPTGDALTVDTTPINNPVSGSVSLAANGDFTYTPNAGFTGSDSFSYEVCDTAALCDTADVTISVTATAGPDAVDDSFSTTKNTAVSDNVLDNDTHPAGDPLTADTTPVTDVMSGALTLTASGVFTYTPNTDFVGSDSFVYSVCDSVAVCDTATVSLTVSDVLPPDAQDDSFLALADTPLTENVLTNDTDPAGGDLMVTTTPVTDVMSGTLTLEADGDFTYTPDAGFTGLDRFTYEVCNDAGACATAEVLINVNPPPNGTLTHTVQRGEWLIQIARCYGTTTDAIRNANYLWNPHRIYPGWQLTIPNVGSVGPVTGPPCIKTYTVKAGDTTASIAAMFGIRESELRRINGIPYYTGFYVGQFIVVPDPVPAHMAP